MPEATPGPESRRFLGNSTSWRRTVVLAAALAALLVVLYGGYEHHWPWTGINGSTATLWDWLHLLLLPIAVVILPIWLSKHEALGSQHKAAGFTILTAFVAVVLFGYLTPWTWTGFTGNTFWDWLELLALPLAVALVPVIATLHGGWQRRDWLILVGLLLLFLVPVLGGYLGNWRWTGFRGNTLWDWLHLLILPLLVPTILVPALKPFATPDEPPEIESQPPAGPQPGATPSPPLEAPPPEDRARSEDRPRAGGQDPLRARAAWLAVIAGSVAVAAVVAVILAASAGTAGSATLKQDVGRMNAIVQLFIAGKQVSQGQSQYAAAAQNRTLVLARLSALQAPPQLRSAAATLREMTADSLAYNLLMAQGETAQAKVPDAAHNALRPQFVSQFNPYAQRYLRVSYTANQL